MKRLSISDTFVGRTVFLSDTFTAFECQYLMTVPIFWFGSEVTDIEQLIAEIVTTLGEKCAKNTRDEARLYLRISSMMRHVELQIYEVSPVSLGSSFYVVCVARPEYVRLLSACPPMRVEASKSASKGRADCVRQLPDELYYPPHGK